MKGSLNSAPICVRWHGWESDTYTLRRAGWQVFADERMSDYDFAHTVRLMVKDPEDKILIMGELTFEPEQLLSGDISMYQLVCRGGVEMQLYRATDRVMVREMPSMAWESMDAALPCDGLVTLEQTHNIEELKLFTYKEHPKEIIVPLQSVDECLNRILAMQYPDQQKIKTFGEPMVRPVAEAKIYSLAS